jgi:hypothetical protein
MTTIHFVGQVGNLPPIENRPLAWNAHQYRPIFNRRQDTILPHIGQS